MADDLTSRLARKGIVPPERFDPAVLIRYAYDVGQVAGYKWVRPDRGQTKSGFYYEWGYAGFTVRVRFSSGPAWEITREIYTPQRARELVRILETENAS